MKFKLPTKRILAFLQIVLVYTIIFGIVGNCEDYTESVAIDDTYKIESSSTANNYNDTYSISALNDIIIDNYNAEVTDVQTIWKSGKLDYSIFKNFQSQQFPTKSLVTGTIIENDNLVSATEETTTTSQTTTEETTTTSQTTTEETTTTSQTTTEETTTTSQTTTEETTTTPETTTTEETTTTPEATTTEETTTSTVKPDDSNPPSAHEDNGETITVYDSSTGSTVTVSVYDAVCHETAQEVSSSFDEEAIKAQAVAAYTYMLNEISRGVTPTVNLNKSVPTKTANCVSQVLGIAMYYNGNPIFSPYSASTGGATASSKDVWGGHYPYLVSVESKYDYLASGSYYKSSKTYTESEVRNIIESKTNITLSNSPENWFAFLSADQGGVLDGGYIGKMLIDGHSTYNSSGSAITGRVMREKLFSLRSTKFEISYENGVFIFTIYGYGHGVGLSQIGSNLYAINEDWTYDQILKHYYTGVEIK